MKTLAWWFRVVGLIYIVLGVTWAPFLNTTRVDMLVPGFDGAVGGAAWNGFVDYLFMFGLEQIVLGAFLLYASFRSAWQEPLVWLLIAFSIVRGIGHDLYQIVNGYAVLPMVVFIVFHLALIVTGAAFSWRAKAIARGVRLERAAVAA